MKDDALRQIQSHTHQGLWQTISGFTLTETMLVLAVFTIMLSAIFTVLTSGTNSWHTGATYGDIQNDIRQAKEYISKDLLQGRFSTLAISGSNIDMDIPASVASGGYITWKHISYYVGGDNNTQLFRNEAGLAKIIANNISLLSFAQGISELGVPVPHLVTISITAAKQDVRGRPMNAVSIFDICLRN